MRKIFVAIGVLGLGYGIYSYYLQQAEILQKLNYKIIGGRVLRASFSQVEVQLNVEVTNASSISLTMTDYKFDIFIGSKKVAVIQNASVNQVLNKNGGVSLFPLNIVIDNTSLLDLDVIGSITGGIRDLEISVKGSFGIKKGILKFKDIEFDETFRLGDYM